MGYSGWFYNLFGFSRQFYDNLVCLPNRKAVCYSQLALLIETLFQMGIPISISVQYIYGMAKIHTLAYISYRYG